MAAASMVVWPRASRPNIAQMEPRNEAGTMAMSTADGHVKRSSGGYGNEQLGHMEGSGVSGGSGKASTVVRPWGFF